MKKKAVALLVALMLLTCVAAIAQTGQTPFGGTLAWPSFAGVQLGVSMPYVLLWEENEQGNTPELVDPQVASLDMLTNETALRYHIGTADVCGTEMDVYYLFTDNTFTRASCETTVADEAQAKALCEAIAGEFETLYGAGSSGYGDALFNMTWMDLGLNDAEQIEMHSGSNTKVVMAPEVLQTAITVYCEQGKAGYTITASVRLKYVHQDAAYYEEYAPYTDSYIAEHGQEALQSKYFDARYYQTEAD